MLWDRVQAEGFCQKGIIKGGKGRGETDLQGQEQQERGKRGRKREGPEGNRKTKREKEREKDRGGYGPFKRENNEYAQVVLLMAAAEGIFCQNPKGRIVQIPEY